VTELWEVLAGRVPGRGSDAQVTVFDSVGFALEDFSALRYMRDLAIEEGVEDQISLIPELANPKNLFGCLPVNAPLQSAAPVLQAA
jgi:ornithine cyclodeaminase